MICRYHSLAHLTQMFGEMDRHVATLARPDLVVLAIFFHEYVTAMGKEGVGAGADVGW